MVVIFEKTNGNNDVMMMMKKGNGKLNLVLLIFSNTYLLFMLDSRLRENDTRCGILALAHSSTAIVELLPVTISC